MGKKVLKMNKIVISFLLSIFIISAQENPTSWNSKQNKKSSVAGESTVFNSIIVKEVNSAITDPYRYIRTGRLEKLITMLTNNMEIVIQVVSSDSLTEERINSTKIRRNNYDRCVLNIIRYAQVRNHDREIAQQSLCTSALLAERKIENPKLALSIYKLAQASNYEGASELVNKIQEYLKHEYSYITLLKEPWRGKKENEKLAYITKLQNVLDEYPESLLELKFSRQIGDVYYSMERYRPMMKWYRKVVAIDSMMARETPVGYRMGIGKKILLRKSIFTGIYLTYCFVLLIVIISLFKLKNFQWRLFSRRVVLSAPIFIVIAAITLLLDFKITSGSISSSLTNSDVFFPKPIVAFSILDPSCIKDLIIVLLIGFLPIILSIFYTSFRNSHSKRLLFILLPLILISTWSHYFVNRIYDEKLNKRVVITKSHIYFDGELEELLIDNPQKILKANPNLLKSNNKDLDIFVKKNKPQLLNN